MFYLGPESKEKRTPNPEILSFFLKFYYGKLSWVQLKPLISISAFGLSFSGVRY